MMKLMHNYFFEPLEFIENKINVLVIENPIIFSKLINEILQQKDGFDGNFLLSLNNNIIDINKNIEIITDVFNLDFNSKKILNKIYNNLKEIGNIEMLEESKNLYFQISKFLENIIQSIDYPLTYNLDIDITNILKIGNLSIDVDDNNILDKILSYIILYRNIFNIKLFVFINLKTFLSKEQLLDFYKMINYEKVYVLLLENNIRDTIMLYEKIKILDNDLCELY